MIKVTKQCIKSKARYIKSFLGKKVPIPHNETLKELATKVPKSQNKLIDDRIEHFRQL